MLYCQQVNVKIDHDWSRTKTMVTKMLALESQVAESESYGAADHYDLRSLGTISKHTTSKSWYRLSSPVVNKTMPWLPELFDTLKELKPDDGSISVMQGNGAEHIDWPHLQTALNFVIENTDPAAYTWVRHEDHYESYPSVANSAWILDTQKLHGISNAGERWTLSIHFNTDYELVKQWFNANPNLEFGQQHVK
jgi:hypothetical protein